MPWESGMAMHRPLAVALLSLAAAAPVPRLVPARDVTVEYQVQPPGRAAVDVRVAIAAGGTKLQIAGDDLPTSFLVDRQTETAAIVLPLLQTYTRVSIARYDPAQTVLRGAGFARGGHDRVAGIGCTHWSAHSPQGGADACITPDGVILTGTATSDRKGALGSVRALRVRYGALPPEIFAVPANYSESALGQAAAAYMK